MRQLGPLESKNGVGNLVAEQNSPQVSGLEADSSLGWQDSINMNLFNQNLRKKDFFINFGKLAFQNSDTSLD